MARRLEPDDEVRRFSAVYLGPPGWDLPFHVRYSAYALGALIFATVLLFEALTPVPIGTPPTWELAITVLGTYAVMQAVDHDKPLPAVTGNALEALRIATTRNPAPQQIRPRLANIVKTTKEPL